MENGFFCKAIPARIGVENPGVTRVVKRKQGVKVGNHPAILFSIPIHLASFLPYFTQLAVKPIEIISLSVLYPFHP
jgi:hypothetical protein